MPYGGDPQHSDTDAVRSLVHDTSTSPVLTDNEVVWLVAQHPNVYLAAAAAAEMIAGSKSEAVVMKKIDGLSMMFGDAKGSIGGMFRELAASLRLQAVRRGVAPYAGGISVADKASQESDSDWDRSEVSLGMHDNPGGSTSGVAGF